MAVYLEQLAEAKARGLTREIGGPTSPWPSLNRPSRFWGRAPSPTSRWRSTLLQNRKVVEFCQAHGIAITAYMPLAYGKVLAEPLLMEIGQRTASSAAQVSLAWLLAQGMTAIPSSTKRGESGRQPGCAEGTAQQRRDGRHRHPWIGVSAAPGPRLCAGY